MSVFPDEIFAAPRRLDRETYPKLIHYNRLPEGGHFAAWEQPELFWRRSAPRSGRFASRRWLRETITRT